MCVAECKPACRLNGCCVLCVNRLAGKCRLMSRVLTPNRVQQSYATSLSCSHTHPLRNTPQHVSRGIDWHVIRDMCILLPNINLFCNNVILVPGRITVDTHTNIWAWFNHMPLVYVGTVAAAAATMTPSIHNKNALNSLTYALQKLCL